MNEILRTEALAALRRTIQDKPKSDMSKGLIVQLEQVLATDVGNPVSLVEGSPAITIQGVRYIYEDRILSSDDSTVELTNVRSVENGAAVLETVRKDNLVEHGFPTLASWRGYLSTQLSNGVSFQTKSAEHRGTVFTVYRIPGGFHSLEAAKFQLQSKDEGELFQLVGQVGTAVEASKWTSGKHQSVGPKTIFVDLTGVVRLVGLGLATVAPIYPSSKMFRLDERTPVTYQKNCALIAAELIFDAIPCSNEPSDEFLSRRTRAIPRPLQYVWSRMVAAIPDRRYPDWNLALGDIQSAASLQRFSSAVTDPVQRQLFDIVTYLDFRASIMHRNPQIKVAMSRRYTRQVAERFFRDIQSVDTGDEPKLMNPFGKARNRLCPKPERRSLMLVPQVLLSLAEGYLQACRRDPAIGSALRTNVPADLLLCTIWMEAEALVKNQVVSISENYGAEVSAVLDKLRSLAANVSREQYGALRVSFSPEPSPQRILSELIAQPELREMVDIIEAIIRNPRHDASQLNFDTLAQLELASHILLGRVCIVDQGRSVSVGLDRSDESSVTEWLRSLHFVSDLLNPTEHHEWSEQFVGDINEALGGFIRKTARLNPMRRRDATVLRYNYVRREGRLRYQYRLVRFRDIEFDESAIGTAKWERYFGILIPCTVDLKMGEQTGLGSFARNISIPPIVVEQFGVSGLRMKAIRFFRTLRCTLSDESRDRVERALMVVAIVLFVVGLVASIWLSASAVAAFVLNLLVRRLEVGLQRRPR